MKTKKTITKKKVVAKKKVTKLPIVDQECVGSVKDTLVDNGTVEMTYNDIKKGGYESFSYQRRAEDFVEEHVKPTPTRIHWAFYVVVVFGIVYLVLR